MSLAELQKMYDEAKKNYENSRSDYDAGIMEGYNRIIDIMKLENLKGITDILTKGE